MKIISSAKQAMYRTLFILVAMPSSTIAGIGLDKTIENDPTLAMRIIALFVVSLCGGVSSTFVKTMFDDGIKHPNLFKIFVGTCLGTTSGLLIIDNFSFGIFSIMLPVFVLASLGAPIMVFYLMWLSNPETQEEIKEVIKSNASRFGVKK